MQSLRNYLALSALGIVLLLSGCAIAPPPPPPKPVPTAVAVPSTPAPRKQASAKKGSYWNGDGVSGASSITISLGEQRAYFYKGGKLVGVSAISSGKKGFDTPVGSFEVIQKDKDHASNLYGEYVSADGEVVKRNADVTKDKAPPGATFKGAKMPFFMRFHEGAGMHAGHLPGGRASHGCVRMPRFMAEHFFHNVELGTPVKVTK
jgi:lipoprotein-anchoring transpeptidase ErfK/SrfK